MKKKKKKEPQPTKQQQQQQQKKQKTAQPESWELCCIRGLYWELKPGK